MTSPQKSINAVKYLLDPQAAAIATQMEKADEDATRKEEELEREEADANKQKEAAEIAAAYAAEKRRQRNQMHDEMAQYLADLPKQSKYEMKGNNFFYLSNADMESCIGAVDKIHEGGDFSVKIMIFAVNLSDAYLPFLQILLQNQNAKETGNTNEGTNETTTTTENENKQLFSLPAFKFSCSPADIETADLTVKNKCFSVLLDSLNKNIVHHFHRAFNIRENFRGFVATNKESREIIAVFDVTNMRKQLDALFDKMAENNSSHFSWSVMDEIVNHRKILDVEISRETVDTFLKNPCFLHMRDNNHVFIPTPRIVYALQPNLAEISEGKLRWLINKTTEFSTNLLSPIKVMGTELKLLDDAANQLNPENLPADIVEKIKPNNNNNNLNSSESPSLASFSVTSSPSVSGGSGNATSNTNVFSNMFNYFRGSDGTKNNKDATIVNADYTNKESTPQQTNEEIKKPLPVFAYDFKNNPITHAGIGRGDFYFFTPIREPGTKVKRFVLFPQMPLTILQQNDLPIRERLLLLCKEPFEDNSIERAATIRQLHIKKNRPNNGNPILFDIIEALQPTGNCLYGNYYQCLNDIISRLDDYMQNPVNFIEISWSPEDENKKANIMHEIETPSNETFFHNNLREEILLYSKLLALPAWAAKQENIEDLRQKLLTFRRITRANELAHVLQVAVDDKDALLEAKNIAVEFDTNNEFYTSEDYTSEESRNFGTVNESLKSELESPHKQLPLYAKLLQIPPWASYEENMRQLIHLLSGMTAKDPVDDDINNDVDDEDDDDDDDDDDSPSNRESPPDSDVEIAVQPIMARPPPVILQPQPQPPPVVEQPQPPIVVEAAPPPVVKQPLPPVVVEAPPPVVEQPLPPVVVEAPLEPVVEQPLPPVFVEAESPPHSTVVEAEAAPPVVVEAPPPSIVKELQQDYSVLEPKEPFIKEERVIEKPVVVEELPVENMAVAEPPKAISTGVENDPETGIIEKSINVFETKLHNETKWKAVSDDVMNRSDLTKLMSDPPAWLSYLKTTEKSTEVRISKYIKKHTMSSNSSTEIPARFAARWKELKQEFFKKKTKLFITRTYNDITSKNKNMKELSDIMLFINTLELVKDINTFETVSEMTTTEKTMVESIRNFVKEHPGRARLVYGGATTNGGTEDEKQPTVKMTQTVTDNLNINNLLAQYNCIYFVEDDVPYWAVMTNTLFTSI